MTLMLGPPFSRMGMQGPILTSVVSPRYPRQVSRPLAPQSQPQDPLCISLNVLQKRKRQRDSLAYPNALHNESGDSLLRRPLKRHKLFLELSASSAESSSDIAITEEHDSAAVTKRSYDAKSTYVGGDICCANIPSDCAPSAPHYANPPSKLCQNSNARGHHYAVPREMIRDMRRLITPIALMNVSLTSSRTVPDLLRILKTLLLCQPSISPECNFPPRTVHAFLSCV
ncbi:hypothetical protein EDD22DRAFT_947899 [Suillus occidentalis]|nr:hypothetical protein EDD22DRAFT_947899 [Suillus occidentalis]